MIFSFTKPRFDWLQLEVTTYCNAMCSYCPHTVYGDKWQNRHMSLETFKRILPYLQKTGHVHLQGWGEPLLNPDFFTMVKLAKKAGCRVGTTTNGMLVDDTAAERIVANGVDVIAFSLAGTGERNDAVRRGTGLEAVMAGIKRLQKVKEKTGARGPVVHVAYMLLWSALEELERLPDLLEGCGVSDVVISTLDFIPSRHLEREVILPKDVLEPGYLRELLSAVACRGGETGIRIHYRICSGQRKQQCTENVQQAAVISAAGTVHPCVFTNLPVDGVTYILNGRENEFTTLAFGNVNEQSLSRIWGLRNYVEFRRSFFTGELADTCRKCPKLYLTLP